MINYQDIINSLQTEKIINLMMRLGASTYIEHEGYIQFPTICHNLDSEEASLKLYYYKDTHLFVCYTECGAGSIFKFLENYYNTRAVEYDWYNDIYRVVLGCTNETDFNFSFAPTYKSQRDKYKNNAIIPTLTEYPNDLVAVFENFYPTEWLNDGITPSSMDKFNIKFSSLMNKIIIPHYNVNGKLVGIRGRALNPEEIEQVGKYMPVQIENKWYSHPLSLNLYGLNLNKDNIRKNKIAYIFESEKSVMQFDGFERDNCAVAICGSNLNKYQIRLLMQSCAPEEIVLCLDKEELPGQDKYFMKLWNTCSKYKQYCRFSFIYDRSNLLNLKDSPTDKGEVIFDKLLQKRTFI